MNSITRMLAVIGIGVAAGVSIGAGPAQAVPGAGHDGTHRVTLSGPAHWNDDDDVIDYFSSPMQCERVGRFGELRGRWDDYDCSLVRFGFHRGDWALEASSGHWGGGFHVNRPPFGGLGGHHHGGGFGSGDRDHRRG